MMRYVFHNCRIIDGTGKPAIDNGLVIVDKNSGKLLRVGPGEVDSNSIWEEKGDLIVDLGGRTVIPGLFNVHTHLGLRLPYTPYKTDPFLPTYWSMIAYRRAVEALVSGVTTLRCVGDPYGADIAVRNAIRNGMVWGPRLIAAGGVLIAHGGHGFNSLGSVECSGVGQFREAARNQLKAGADMIKICLSGGLATPGEGFADKQMTDDEIEAVVEVAHMAGKYVAAHVGGDKPVQDAVRLGVKCIEHGYVMKKETIDAIISADAWLVPTLAVTHAFDYLEAHGSPAYHLEKAREAARFHKDSISRAISAGVKIAVGTDLLPSDPLGGTNATVREIELLVEAGMSPLQAIHAATLAAATLCGVESDTGSLEVGKTADLVVVDGSPDKRIEAMREMQLVMHDGKLVWSRVPSFVQKPFCVLADGEIAQGGTFIRW